MNEGWPTLHLSLALFVVAAAACGGAGGEVSRPGRGAGAGGDEAGDDADDDDGARGDAAGGDAGEGNGGGGQEGGRSDCDPPEDSCPDRMALSWPETRNGAAGALPIRVIIEAVDFAGDRLVLRNVSQRPIALEGWDVVLDSFAHPAFPEGLVLLPGSRIALSTRGQGTNDECHVWSGQGANAYDLKAEVGELGVRADMNKPAVLDNLEAYVRWGADPPDPGTRLRDEAAAAGLWADLEGGFVPTTGDTPGIVATGDLSTPAGWRVPQAPCFGIGQ